MSFQLTYTPNGLQQINNHRSENISLLNIWLSIKH